MARRKKRRTMQRIIIGISFLLFSAILVVNNSTQLLQTYGLPLSKTMLTYIAFAGGLASAIWAIILASMGEFS